MSILLFSGRHLLTTRFQERYLGEKLRGGGIEEVVFAITSANQANSRYNPIPVEIRAVGVDRFARDVCAAAGVRWRIVPVPHYRPTEKFAEFLLKEIAEATEGELVLVPGNAVVLSSTPEVIAQFAGMGFGVLTGELESVTPPRYGARTPIEVLQRVVAADDPLGDAGIAAEISAATAGVWRDFPDVLRRVVRLYRDPILTQEGSLTEMRNYSVYAQGMNERALLELKYRDIRAAIVPGKIVDEGCSDGALLVPIARDFPDSDLMGIEITGEFLARCHERQRAMEFGGTFIHFHQRNIMESIFRPDSIDTTICNSTTHELWSYGRQEETLRRYLAEKYRQLRRGGRLVVRDVVGPEGKEEDVLLWCDEADGSNDDVQRTCVSPAELEGHLRGLSTAARFERFAEDFLADQRKSGRRGMDTKLQYERVELGGRKFFKLRLRNAMEFLMKKDYAANWGSELNEEFCFWNFAEWKQALRDAGFAVVEGAGMSHAYASEWIVANRFEGKAEIYRAAGETLEKMAWPVTHMVLVGQK